MATIASPATGREHVIGFSTLSEEVELDRLAVTGELPQWLEGTLLRNGPGRFEDDERSVNHWFDGLAMLHRFTIAGGDVSYGNRFLRSRAYGAVDESGRLGFSEFATDPCRSLFKRLATSFSPATGDNCNVNVSRLGEEFIAMTESPIAVVFDPQTLETAGVGYEAPGQITTAHPHEDRARGEAVNLAVHMGPRTTYRFFGQKGRDEQRRIATVAVSEPGYIHSFAITEHFLVIAEGPFVVNPLRLGVSNRPYIENYRWKPERGTRYIVVERETGALRGIYKGAPLFLFHHVNAFERGDELIVDMCAYEDPSVIDALRLDSVRSAEPAFGSSPRLMRARISLTGGTVTEELLVEQDMELPRIAYGRHNGREYRYAYGIGADDELRPFRRIVKADVAEGRTEVWEADGCYVGEPVFVARPGGEGEDDGVLLSVVLDGRRGGSFLLALDAQDLGELARAEVPHHIPFGFHGQFARA
jgi:carotenoid cleavage dioxygenase-like enzyme